MAEHKARDSVENWPKQILAKIVICGSKKYIHIICMKSGKINKYNIWQMRTTIRIDTHKSWQQDVISETRITPIYKCCACCLRGEGRGREVKCKRYLRYIYWAAITHICLDHVHVMGWLAWLRWGWYGECVLIYCSSLSPIACGTPQWFPSWPCRSRDVCRS